MTILAVMLVGLIAVLHVYIQPEDRDDPDRPGGAGRGRRPAELTLPS